MRRSACRKAYSAPGVLPVLVMALLTMTACEEIMDVSFTGNGAGTLVVEGSITTDTMKHIVILSYSGDYFHKGQQEMATGAEVTITGGTDTFRLQEAEPGMYYTGEDAFGVTGRTYTLDIRLGDGKRFTASDRISRVTGIDSIRQSQNYNTYSGYGYDVLFYGQEPQPAGDYYLYNLYIDDTLYSDTITGVSFASDEFVNGNYVRELPVYRIRENMLGKNPRRVTLEMSSISESFYQFLTALMTETRWRGSPWDGPPANIPGNISNGAYGFFRASDVRRKSRIFFPLPRAN